MQEILKISHLSKKFGNNTVLKDINLSLNSGEILTILGGSGCGKSTLLRIIANLETADGGDIELLGDEVCKNGVCSKNKKVGMMFQNYALFPHINVSENIAFALHALPKYQRNQKVLELLDKFHISELKDKMIDKISGGQAQRVAFARAVANEERLLLLDEPFANLDSHLKNMLRNELKAMIKENSLSAIMVTHDKFDAFLLSDKIALISRGEVLACATPRELYFEPKMAEIAKFLGDINEITADAALSLPDKFKNWLEAKNFMFRPEEIISSNEFEAKVISSQFLGANYKLELDFMGVRFHTFVSSIYDINSSFKFGLA
ncbi:ABC transporter ATP-binding protein [Campylobacter fetus]|nr:ABC transporter ATP-binding protein [Campylobacter fetus]OCS18542.1 iron ABC transporter ATP-binding protein [Campylobacter fetus subsp. fetus BT 10/98]WNY78257.1 ABC transporter ATP-binding protein [Campylobacter fetus subsp. fetus]EAH8300038.1 ABC transporter ATP-binding protein [Campylobacter fetus]EAI7232530.1 ABC transporter ATP-binding protein [Campylobacter fetus]EAJ5689612.1 ABC transporter ATP-binding protein [Campylobacter fetus]